MKIIKLAPAERKIGLSIRALKSDEFRADWESYQESAGDGTATLGRSLQEPVRRRAEGSGLRAEARAHDALSPMP